MKFKQTGLWRSSLGPRDGDLYAEERESVRAAYDKFWQNGVQLAGQIAKDLPELTLHDERHFEALWDRADQIAGPNYELSPLEAFVFGGAVLLHDAANSLAAFTGGRAEIERTPEWRDALADFLTETIEDSIEGRTKVVTQEIKAKALFSTLRMLHARRAEELGALTLQNAGAGTHVHLIPDDQLRDHLGPLIGLIAASHHWDLPTLESRLPRIRGALSGLPREWKIRPILIACLLRCADALQIDQARTPDFLYALLQLRGVSELHWRAQNRLSTPVIDEREPDAIVVSSTRPFLEADADAWWIAHDAVQVADKELQTSNVLLRDFELPPFAVTRIRDADSPVRLSKHIIAHGWRPVSAEVRVNRVDRVVSMFGGRELYGKDDAVPVRELIQNAIDAVRMRRAIEPQGSSYRGQVTVKIESCEDSSNGQRWLIVEDDGLGMSERVLTGPLIDFGASYVSSELAKSERPGLSANASKRIGRYGIGFFSVFMIGTQVRVSSRPFDKGLDQARTLVFRDGLSLRPLLLEHGTTLGSNISTAVAALVSSEDLALLLSVSPLLVQTERVPISLSRLVGLICGMVDVDVYVEDLDHPRALVHSAEWWRPEDRAAWLRRISPISPRGREASDEHIEQLAAHLQFIDPAEPSAGLACVNFRRVSGGYTVGGLAGELSGSFVSAPHCGLIDCNPDGPKRTGRQIRSSKIGAWASEQAIRLGNGVLEGYERHTAARFVAEYDGDAMPVANAQVNGTWKSVDGIVDMLKGGEIINAAVRAERVGPSHERIHLSHVQPSGFVGIEAELSDTEYRYSRHVMEFLSTGFSQYVGVEMNGSYPPLSFLGILERVLRSHGFEMQGERRVEDIATYVGVDSERDGLRNGQSLSADVYVLTAIASAETPR